MAKNKILKLIAAAVLILGVVAAVYVLTKNEPQPQSDSTRPISETQKAANYSCHYQDGANHARCLDKSDDKVGGCYGYYDLRSSNIVDGIVLESGKNRSTTCEGFSTRDNLFFDTSGNLVK